MHIRTKYSIFNLIDYEKYRSKTELRKHFRMNKSKVRGHKGNMTHFFPESLFYCIYCTKHPCSYHAWQSSSTRYVNCLIIKRKSYLTRTFSSEIKWIILISDMIFLCLFRYYQGRGLVSIVFLYKTFSFLLPWRLFSQIFAFYSPKIFFVKVHLPLSILGTGSRQKINILTNCRYLVCFFLFSCFTNLEFPSVGGGCMLNANFRRSRFAQPWINNLLENVCKSFDIC